MLDMDTQSIIVLGNGFDVALGIATRYSQFYENSKDLRFLADNGNELCQHILVNIKSDYWSDLETGLYLYSRGITHKYGVGNREQAEKFEREFNELRTALFNYLSEVGGAQVEAIDGAPAIGLNLEWHKLQPQYLTFNYSVNTAVTATVNSRYIYNGNDSINELRFIYQHGSIYDSETASNNTPSEIVVGIDSTSQQVEEAHSFLYKTQQHLHDLGSTLDYIGRKSFYVIYGCSVGDSDATYFRAIFNNNQHDKTFLIYGFGEEAIETIKANIERICGISVETLLMYNRVVLLDVTRVAETRDRTRTEIEYYLHSLGIE